MELARVSMEKSKAEKKIYELSVALDEEDLKRTVIRAPCAGEIFRIMNRPGEAAQEQRPVLKMVCMDPLYVIAYPPISTAGRIKVGMTEPLSLENHGGKASAMHRRHRGQRGRCVQRHLSRQAHPPQP